MVEVEEGRRGTETVAAYLGHVKHMDSANLVKKAFAMVGWYYVI